MRVLIKDERVDDRRQADGQAEHEGVVQPFPHFINIVMTVRLGGNKFLLVLDPCPNLFHGLFHHFFFRSQRWDRLGHPAALHLASARQAARCKRRGDSKGLRNDQQ